MANEKRLIDANALEFEPDENCIANGVLIWGGRTGGKTMTTVLHALKAMVDNAPTVDAVEVEQYKALLEMYHELRENFIDYYCSGAQNVAPYCLNKSEECVDKWGYCKQYSDYCKGFNPAEMII